MRGVFISYRRRDSSGYAGRLHDLLVERYGKHRVFIDVASIAPGQDFERAIDERLSRSSIVLVLIGPNWLPERRSSSRSSDRDFVYLEVAAALKSQARVIPVMLDGAEMPGARRLPRAIQPLTSLNAIELRHRSFRADVKALMQSLTKTDRSHGRSHDTEPSAELAALRRTPLPRDNTPLKVIADLHDRIKSPKVFWRFHKTLAFRLRGTHGGTWCVEIDGPSGMIATQRQIDRDRDVLVRTTANDFVRWLHTRSPKQRRLFEAAMDIDGDPRVVSAFAALWRY